MFEAARPKGESAEFCEPGCRGLPLPAFFSPIFFCWRKKMGGMGEEN